MAAAPPLKTGDADAAAFFARPDHRVAIENAALDGFDYQIGACSSAKVTQFLPPQSPRPGKAIFDRWGQLIAGAVEESVIVEGCGKKSQENIATVSESGHERSIVVTPGSTRDDLPLMHNTIVEIARALQSKSRKSCKNRKVIDTRFEGYDGASDSKADLQSDDSRPYWETWTIDDCGRELKVPVYYTPEPKGTKIRVKIK